MRNNLVLVTASVALLSLAFALLLDVKVHPASSGRRVSSPDWPSFYAGSKLVGTPGLYSFKASQKITDQFMGGGHWVWAFVRPPFYAAMLAPMRFLTPRQAVVAWQLLNVAALTAAVVLLWPSFASVLVLAVCAPVHVSFKQGQDMPLLLLFIALSVTLIRRRKLLLAGLILSLCLTKFHLLLLLPVFLLAGRQGKLAFGFAAGAAMIMAVSFAVQGWDWPWLYYYCLMENQARIPSPPYSLVWGQPIWLKLIWSGAVAFACYVLCRRSHSSEMMLSIALAMGLLVVPRMYFYDATIALPLVFAVAKREFSS